MNAERAAALTDAFLLALSLPREAIDQLFTLAGSDGPNVRVAYGELHPENARLVLEEDGFAKLNPLGASVILLVFQFIEASIAHRDGRAS